MSNEAAPRPHILILGQGSREHALSRTLAKSPLHPQVFVAPGNDGIAHDPLVQGGCVPISATEHQKLLSFCDTHAIDLVVVGPEAPLCDGIVDVLSAAGVRVIGPVKAAAQLESSKLFAKRIMASAGIPTASWSTLASSLEEATQQLQQCVYPCVLKADGLAGGKGSFIVRSIADALDVVHKLRVERIFGAAGDVILVEELLVGKELSYMGLTDGECFLPFSSSQDFKRLSSDDASPNTGGMGAISPSPECSPELEQMIQSDIVAPLLQEMLLKDFPYQGFIYVGLMLTSEGPKVLEFNVRLGDPETQAVLGREGSGDLLEALLMMSEGKLSAYQGDLRHQGHAVCVVSASQGYPLSVQKGDEIVGLTELLAADAEVFCAGLKYDADADMWLTDGGRVLSVVAEADSLDEAVERVYALSSRVFWRGLQRRDDIG